MRSLRRAVKDVVFLNSRGEVTCYGHDGAGGGGAHGRLMGASDPRVVASLASFSLRVGGAGEVVLAGGATHAALLTPSGYRLNAFKLPGKPVAALLVVDVDGDGLSGVVAGPWAEACTRGGSRVTRVWRRSRSCSGRLRWRWRRRS